MEWKPQTPSVCCQCCEDLCEGIADTPDKSILLELQAEHTEEERVHAHGELDATTSVPRLELPRLLDGGKFEPVPSPGVKAREQRQIKRVTSYLAPLLESD